MSFVAEASTIDDRHVVTCKCFAVIDFDEITFLSYR